jgi:S1-C subfamily serine protease
MSPDNPSSTLPDHVERIAASVVGLATRRHRASALVWRDGVAVASAAMLWRHPRVSIAFPNGEQADGEVRGIDGGTDLAVVTFAGVHGGRRRAVAGADAAGRRRRLRGRPRPSGLMHASFGHVGAVGGEWRTWRGGRLEQLIRLDGGLPPGLVGAPIADAAGRLLGIASHSFSRHHAVVVPVATIERVLDPLLTHGRLPQGYLGIAVQARARDDGRDRRRRPAGHVAGGRRPAARGGLLVGDVIVTLAGQPASSLDALRSHLQVGATVQAVIVRGGQRQELAIDVIQRPSSFCG